MDLVPELAARLGVDAARGLVQKQQLRLMHDAGGKRQSLLPAAGQRACELAAARGETEVLQRRVDELRNRLQAIEPRHEFEVLGDRQVLVERELLRHVADFALDQQALAADVVAKHLTLALVGRQQAAHHADGGGLARAVGTKEADDLALRHAHRHVIDHGPAAEALDEPADLDRVHGACSTTSTS